jgi:hypothetical protein
MPRLDPDRLAEAAGVATGYSDLGGGSWREGLGCLLESLERDAALTELGWAVVEGEVTGYLTSRLEIVAERTARPSIAEGEVVPPIVIIGQGRTGTTILHDLLAQDPQTRVPLTWEVHRPCPPPETATYERDPRIGEVEASTAAIDLVLPEFRAMHPMGARLAQECVRITALEFRSMMFPTQYRVPAYTNWLIHEADMSHAYAWHRVFLQHLQSRHPASRWVLKSPGHIWCLDALVDAYPDAFLVQTHRDPLRIVASIGSLVATLRSIASDTTSIPSAAAEFADYILEGLDRSVTARVDGTIEPARVIDVQFESFMNDPFATIRQIYSRLDIELTREVEHRMREFLAQHPQDRFGRHRYTFAATELDEGVLRERARRYQEYFDVPSEPLP